MARLFSSILATAMVIAYPAAVYFGRSTLEPRALALVLLLLFLPSLMFRSRGARAAHAKALVPLPICIVALLLLTAMFNDQRFVLWLPVGINLIFLTAFGGSLRKDTSMVEHFARLTEDDLSPEKCAYCRRVTLAWSVFFVANASICAWLALSGPLDWWAIYTGSIAYGLMGLMFTVEYIIRKSRFRDYGTTLPDRLLAPIFPPKDHE